MPIWGTNCSQKLRDILEAGFDEFIEFDDLQNNFSRLRNLMNNKWVEVRIECGDDPTTSDNECPKGRAGSSNTRRICICQTKDEDRIPVILLHELVHACGGSELDAEVVERVCYSGQGDTPPNRKDFKKFCRDTVSFGEDKNTRVADFVIWDSIMGEAWTRSEMNGKPIKGNRLFQSDNWKSRCFR